MTETLWTVREVAAYLKIHPQTVRRFMRTLRPLPHRFVGKRARFAKPEVDAWVAGFTPPVQTPAAVTQARAGLAWIEERVRLAQAAVRRH